MWSYQCVCVCVCVCVHVCLQTKQDAEPSDEVTQSADNETAGIDNETNADNDTVGANNEDHDGGAEPAEQDSSLQRLCKVKKHLKMVTKMTGTIYKSHQC